MGADLGASTAHTAVEHQWSPLAKNGDQIPVAADFHPQDAEAAVLVARHRSIEVALG